MFLPNKTFRSLDVVERTLCERLLKLQDDPERLRSMTNFEYLRVCKKIRDDKGYWRQVEEYVREHSEAEFSHGICPDRMRSLSPKIADDVLGVVNKSEK